MRNSLETDRILLDRLSRGQSYLQLGTALATATSTAVQASGVGTDYPQQLVQVSWCYIGTDVVANAITVTVYSGDATQLGTTTIPVGTASGSTGGILTLPIDDYDFGGDMLLAIVAGNVGNPAGSTVGVTALVTAQ